MATGTFNDCIPTGAELRVSNNGNPKLHMWWRVDTGASGIITATADLWLTEKALQRTMKTLVDIGWDPRRDPQELHGAQERELKQFFPDGAQLVLEEETGNDGRIYTKVKWINRKRAAGEVSKAAVRGGNPLAEITARMRAAALMAAPAKTEEFAAPATGAKNPHELEPDESEFGEPLGADALDFP